jgi:hypothetical protein
MKGDPKMPDPVLEVLVFDAGDIDVYQNPAAHAE